MSSTLTKSIILTPCILNPQLRIATFIKTFGLSIEFLREAPLSGFTCAVPCLKDYTFAFPKYRIIEYSKSDVEGRGIGRVGQVFEVFPKDAFKVLVKTVVDHLKVTKALTLKYKDDEFLIREILRRYREIFGQEPTTYPDMYLVTDTTGTILTRLVWVDSLEGELSIYFAGNTVLIVAEHINIDPNFVYELKSLPEVRFSIKKIEKFKRFDQLREVYVDLLTQLTAEEEKATIDVLVKEESKKEKTEEEVKEEKFEA